MPLNMFLAMQISSHILGTSGFEPGLARTAVGQG